MKFVAGRYIEWVVLGLAGIILLVASAYKLSEAPAIWFDEGFYTQAAMNLAEHGTQGLQTAPGTFISNAYITVGYPLLFPVSLSYQFFGVGVTQGRAVMVLFILAFAAASYVLARMLFGRTSAAWAILMLASFPILYGNGKPVLGEVPGMLFLLLTFIALVKLERSNYQSAWSYVAAGFAAGLCVVTKPIFLLLLPSLLFVLILRRRNIALHWGGFALAVGAFLLPALLWAYLQFGGDATFSKQLEYYIGSPYAIDNRLQLAVTNFLQFFTQIKSVYSVTLPIFVWCVSLYIRKKRGVTSSSVELVMLAFTVCILLHYLTIQSYSRYFFQAQLVVLLIVPYALLEIFRYLSGKFNFIRKVSWLPYAFMGLLALGQLYQLAHSSYVAGYYSSTKTADVRRALNGLDPKSSFFLYDSPEVAILLPSRDYYQYIDAATDLKIGASQLAVLTNGRADYAIVNSDIYTQNPAPFAAYTLAFETGGYDFFKSK